MSEPTLDEKIRAAFRDLDLLRSGWRPGASVDSVLLTDWYPIMHRELDLPALAGFADHPRLGKSIITTSPVIWHDESFSLARCVSRWYRLERPGRPFLFVPTASWEDVENLRYRIAR